MTRWTLSGKGTVERDGMSTSGAFVYQEYTVALTQNGRLKGPCSATIIIAVGCALPNERQLPHGARRCVSYAVRMLKGRAAQGLAPSFAREENTGVLLMHKATHI